MCCRNQRVNRCASNNSLNNSIYASSCSNSNQSVFPENYLYGHAYTPNQTLENTFIPEVGLQNGSIFPELISPYSPGQSIDFIEYLRRGGNANE